MSLPVFWVNKSNVSENINSLTKTSSDAWDAGAASTQMFLGDVSASFTISETNTYRMFGLSHTDLNASYTSIEYAIYPKNDGTIGIYENGSSIGDFGSYSINDILTVERIGTTIYYKKNGSTLYTSLISSSRNLFIDTALYTLNATITNAVFESSNYKIFIDAANRHNLTLSVNSDIVTDIIKIDSASVRLGGSSSKIIVSDNLNDFDMGSGAFTIEAWIRFNSVQDDTYIMLFENSHGSFGWQCYLQTYSDYFGVYTGPSYSATNTFVPNINQWYHFVFEGDGSILKWFIDGVQIGTDVTGNLSVAGVQQLYIGCDAISSRAFDGWMDEIRITKGVMRYSSSFTPSTTPLIADANTVLLIHFDDTPPSSLVNLIPLMTSQTTPSGIASSSPLDTLYPEPAFHAMDRDTNSVWLSQWAYSSPWIQYQFPTAQVVLGYSITYTFIYDDRMPTDWILQGSNNGSDWTTLDTQTGESFPIPDDWYEYQKKIFLISNTTAYSYYRITITSHHNSWTNLGEIELLGIASEQSIDIPDTIVLDDAWTIQPSAELVQLINTLTLSDSWNLATNPDSQSIPDIIKLSDSWNLQTNPDSQDTPNSIFLSDSWVINITGTIIKKFQTKLYTILESTSNYFTDLRLIYNSTVKYGTKLYTQFLNSNKYKTDLRLKYAPIDNVLVGTLDDFVVKLDGIELEDVDYTTLIINLNLNTTPSNAQFILARRHDDLDKMLDGTTSIITAENKIEVFDGTRKLFTGYISELNADSTRDVVHVTASDCRLKMSRASMELKYGGAWQIDANHNDIPDDDDTTNDVPYNAPAYIKFEKNIGTAFTEVMTAVGSLVSGYDTLPFSGSFIPEYIKSEKDYTSLIDELIRQTANCNWYIDENERLRFQKIGSGAIKSLPLASLNEKRHPYDLIVDNIQLNKVSSNYTKSLVVKRGKNIIQHWATRTFRGWINSDFIEFMNSLKEKTTFVFHQSGEGSLTMFDPEPGGVGPYYTGMNGLAIAYYNSLNGGWISYPSIIVQWLNKDTSTNLPDITIGSGLPTKTLYLTSYGKKVSNLRWGEEIKVSNNPNSNIGFINPISDRAYLTRVQDENYDYTSFLLDIANFELSQNNVMQSSADLSMLLDAYEYYNLSFMDLINLSNTIQVGIYKDNNGFPLNIDNIQINCATRTVNLSLTNSGKSWYAKTGNCLGSYTPPNTRYIERKWIWTVVQTDGTVITTE